MAWNEWIGGYCQDDDDMTGYVFEYDLRHGIWNQMAGLPSPRHSHLITVLDALLWS